MLNHIERLPETVLFKTIRKVFHPESLCSTLVYNAATYRKDIQVLCETFHLVDVQASIIVSHKLFAERLRDPGHREKYGSYWIRANNAWDPLGVLESYLNPRFDLYKGMLIA